MSDHAPDCLPSQPALLALAEGSVYRGISVGAPGIAVGEVVFNTAMTGYQEILTDPSYHRQLVTLTYPHIGNVGCNPDDDESAEAVAGGLIIRHAASRFSNWRATETLQQFLNRRGIVAISEIDTRALTRKLRDGGAQNGAIVAGDDLDEAEAIELARDFAGLKGMDLAQEVSTTAAYQWDTPTLDLDQSVSTPDHPPRSLHVVVVDFGVKRNILRMLVDAGCTVTVVPARSTAEKILALDPDGVLLANGPGDPEPCDYAIEAIGQLLEANVPLFGICLGHQLLGLATGARSVKMKFGHHGANHPVIDLDSGQVMITSQNHGFAIDEDSLPSHVVATHRSLFDDSLQGIRIVDKPAFSFQGHPEASPGPHDIGHLFEQFVQMMESARAA